jgi:hypothetical protein
MMQKFLPIVYAIGLVIVLAIAALYRQPPPTTDLPPSERTGAMTLPRDYRERYVHYATVDRVDQTVRFLYIDPMSYQRVQRGAPLPDGTQLVIETYRARTDAAGEPLRSADGHFIAGAMIENVHVAEKRSTWRIEDLAVPTGAIDWNFRSFDSQTFMNTDENRNDCFACHDTASRRDRAFTRFRLDEAIARDTTVHVFCNRPARANCH